jgi:VWFA-related protein
MRRLALLLAGAAAFAQQEPTLRVDVRQVLVPVIVTDNKGHRVPGLRQSDFRVFEDGVPQDIAGFSVDMPGAPVKGPRHTYVFCIDTLHAAPASASRVRQVFETLFGKEKPGDAQYALIGIGRKLQVLQPATSNPLELLVRVRSAGFGNLFAGLDASARATEMGTLRRRMEDFCKRCACGIRASQRSCESEVEALKQSVDVQAAAWNDVSASLAEQFRSVVEELARIPTGRTLILISDGFSANSSEDFYAAIASNLPNYPQFRSNASAALTPPLKEALKVAVDRNVTIDAVDSRAGPEPSIQSTSSMDAVNPGGSGIPQSATGLSRNQSTPVRASTQLGPASMQNAVAPLPSPAMEQLASATGGVYLRNEDLLKELRTAMSDGREYYTIAYVSKNDSNNSGFRRIAVELPGKNLTIRAKTGYWASGSAQ